MKIRVKYRDKDCARLKVLDKGEWIDVSYYNEAGENFNFKQGSAGVIGLNIAMELPKGFEAMVAPRSSTWKSGLLQANAPGVIDYKYRGDSDWWGFPYWAFRDGYIEHNDRICQFRIQPSQKASAWTKIKWLFTSKIEFIEVDNFGNENRGGFGTTGKK